jgi:hypothetical protein
MQLPPACHEWRIVALLDRRVKRVHVHVNNFSHRRLAELDSMLDENVHLPFVQFDYCRF